MPKDFIIKGKTVTGGEEVLSFGGRTKGYGFKITRFELWPASAIGTTGQELVGSVTADNTSMDPINPDFDSPGLIAVAYFPLTSLSVGNSGVNNMITVIDDSFIITQDLILAVADTVSGSTLSINWLCRFEKVKLTSSAEAVANFNQFTIYDD